MRPWKIVIGLVLIAIVSAVVLGWMAIRHGFSARDNPSTIEAYIAKTALRLSAPASERDAKNPFMPTNEVLSEARTHFADHCAICHGNDGSGKTEIGQNLYPKAPDMRNSETQDLTDGQLYSIIHNGIRLTGMPAWGAPDKDDDSWRLVLFIRHLTQMTPEEMTEMERFNPKSPMEQAEEQQEQEFLNGGKQSDKSKTNQHPHQGDKK
jgi:mono/diheme cytochrome c family protein